MDISFYRYKENKTGKAIFAVPLKQGIEAKFFGIEVYGLEEAASDTTVFRPFMTYTDRMLHTYDGEVFVANVRAGDSRTAMEILLQPVRDYVLNASGQIKPQSRKPASRAAYSRMSGAQVENYLRHQANQAVSGDRNAFVELEMYGSGTPIAPHVNKLVAILYQGMVDNRASLIFKLCSAIKDERYEDAGRLRQLLDNVDRNL